MFNPEKLLGSLLSSSLGRGGITNNIKAQVGMGLLGVAMEAFEHYANKSSPPNQNTQSAGPPPPPGIQNYVPPSMPAPPPPPPSSVVTSPPPGTTPPVDGCDAARKQEAVLLIRAMIAAANADGIIDQEERQRIFDKFHAANLSQEEQIFLAGELLNPSGINQLTAEVHSVEMARQIYAVSLITITDDTEAERIYLRTLCEQLGLSDVEHDALHQNLRVENI